jgi:hypothetical protein
LRFSHSVAPNPPYGQQPAPYNPTSTVVPQYTPNAPSGGLDFGMLAFYLSSFGFYFFIFLFFIFLCIVLYIQKFVIYSDLSDCCAHG